MKMRPDYTEGGSDDTKQGPVYMKSGPVLARLTPWKMAEFRGLRALDLRTARLPCVQTAEETDLGALRGTRVLSRALLHSLARAEGPRLVCVPSTRGDCREGAVCPFGRSASPVSANGSRLEGAAGSIRTFGAVRSDHRTVVRIFNERPYLGYAS